MDPNTCDARSDAVRVGSTKYRRDACGASIRANCDIVVVCIAKDDRSNGSGRDLIKISIRQDNSGCSWGKGNHIRSNPTINRAALKLADIVEGKCIVAHTSNKSCIVVEAGKLGHGVRAASANDCSDACIVRIRTQLNDVRAIGQFQHIDRAESAEVGVRNVLRVRCQGHRVGSSSADQRSEARHRRNLEAVVVGSAHNRGDACRDRCRTGVNDVRAIGQFQHIDRAESAEVGVRNVLRVRCQGHRVGSSSADQRSEARHRRNLEAVVVGSAHNRGDACRDRCRTGVNDVRAIGED